MSTILSRSLALSPSLSLLSPPLHTPHAPDEQEPKPQHHEPWTHGGELLCASCIAHAVSPSASSSHPVTTSGMLSMPLPKETCGLGSPQKKAATPPKDTYLPPQPQYHPASHLFCRVYCSKMCFKAPHKATTRPQQENNYSNIHDPLAPHAPVPTNTRPPTRKRRCSGRILCAQGSIPEEERACSYQR
jgi:hypothetical protein